MSAPICWPWSVRCRPISPPRHDLQYTRPGAVQDGAGQGRLLCPMAEDLWRRSLGAAGEIHRPADLTEGSRGPAISADGPRGDCRLLRSAMLSAAVFAVGPMGASGPERSTPEDIRGPVNPSK